MKKILSVLSLLAIGATTACSFAARDAAMYAADTQSVVDSRSPQIKACYDEALKTDKNAGGDVVVSFSVEKKTGALVNPQIVRERTTAPEDLGQCVVDALQGLALDPPDQREGAAVYTWRFQANEPVQLTAEPAPAAG